MTVRDKPWMLPEGIEALLPGDAEYLENSRRKLLDLFRQWGYQFVVPPIVDYIESLLTGSGTELDLQTFKLIDQMSGRLLGIRADMTPQVARIDAHHLNTRAPVRLCYLGTVLKTHPSGLTRTRSPFQVGAELYGHKGLESDLEMIRLMLETLNTCGFEDYYLDIGHLGIYKHIVESCQLEADQHITLSDILQRKAAAELQEFLQQHRLKPEIAEALSSLTQLSGDTEVIEKARHQLAGLGQTVVDALDRLERLVNRIRTFFPNISIHIDLAELHGYYYQTDIVFAAYLPGHASELARGGRYDDLTQAYEWGRPATGFSMDLNALMLLRNEAPQPADRILAPAVEDSRLDDRIAELRKAGESVVQALPEQEGTPEEMGCQRRLVLEEDEWVIREIG
ncbi:MAG: ATP phosphoribosyltransferase regulatory subunit [Gammaproteobacteria bacterium]|nr:MAG: ATP phosphoribosyltransferase regulatory subunit [Gammaproteobacteria bacterium]